MAESTSNGHGHAHEAASNTNYLHASGNGDAVISESPQAMTINMTDPESKSDDGIDHYGHVMHHHSDDDEQSDEDNDEDESSSEEDEEDEDEDEDEDEEPSLKYSLLGGSTSSLLQKDSASTLCYANRKFALGTHSGLVHILNLKGELEKPLKAHSASVIDIAMDETAEWIATASLDGQVVVYSLSTPEHYTFDLKRPMRTIALEPSFAKKSSRSFVCGGMAGSLLLYEKGWLAGLGGHKQTVLHTGEGPIWQTRWRGRLIAWANDLGVKIYDTHSQMRIIFIDRPNTAPRADLFKCNLHWQDDSTLLIAWADEIKVARIRNRPRNTMAEGNPNANVKLPPLIVEITQVFQLDCMIAGIVPHFLSPNSSHSAQPSEHSRGHAREGSVASVHAPTALTSFLIVAYTPPDTSFLSGNETTVTRDEQARKASDRPELRIISRAGEELAADALSISGFERWGCNDYLLVDVPVPADEESGSFYVVLSPKDVVVVKPRDWKDHVHWLVERKRYEEALEEIERQQAMGENVSSVGEGGVDMVEIGQKYIRHLISEGEFAKAAHLCPKVCGHDTKLWENWIFVFAQQHQLQAIIPYVPTESPTLGHLVYEMILGYFLAHDRQSLLQMIKTWPKGIYDLPAIIFAIQSELDKAPSSSSATPPSPTSTAPDTTLLMECLAELYTMNRQPSKALQFYIRLRRPNVFSFISENNLYPAVQDQALLLVEFDHELMEKRTKMGEDVPFGPGQAITLLVENVHSIPIGRVVQQLQARPKFLYLYLDLLFQKDPNLTSDFADNQVLLYAEFAPTRLIDYLRASNYYSLERAYKVCSEKDLVPEMVFLLGRMGNNKKALTLIIERLGDVHYAIEFAKEQHDDDLWEDLLRYSESRPTFIRGLLENVGAEIDPIRLIRRIKNGLEIPGLKPALIKILQDFNLQVSLLEGCQTILYGDGAVLAGRLFKDQSGGFYLSPRTTCPICSLPLIQMPQMLVLLYLCRHVVHAHCVTRGGGPTMLFHDDPLPDLDGTGRPTTSSRIAFTSLVRARINQSCPVCHRKEEGER